MNIDLSKMATEQNMVVFSIIVYTQGVNLSQISNAFVRLSEQGGKEFCKFNLSSMGAVRAAAVCRIFKTDKGQWVLHAVGESINAPDSAQRTSDIQDQLTAIGKQPLGMPEPPKEDKIKDATAWTKESSFSLTSVNRTTLFSFFLDRTCYFARFRSLQCVSWVAIF